MASPGAQLSFLVGGFSDLFFLLTHLMCLLFPRGEEV